MSYEAARGLATRIETGVRGLNPAQALILSFLLLSLAGTLLLRTPAATTAPTSWSQAAFTAVSAATVTGLSVVDIGSHYTVFGQCVLLALIQAGGLGLMTFGVFIILLASDRLGRPQRAALAEAMNQRGHANMRHLLLCIFGFTAAMETLGTVLLATVWVPQMGWRDGLFHSFFHAVSAFNNAGFALHADSLTRHAGSMTVNLVIPVLYLTGGLGFVVIGDIAARRRFKSLSTHSKLMLTSTAALTVLSVLAVLALEYSNPATLGMFDSAGNKLAAAWFQGTAPRSGGFNTVDIGQTQTVTALLLMVLMFIGGGSGSTAGGVKLTTVLVLALAAAAFLRGREAAVVFGRSIAQETVLRAMTVLLVSLASVIAGVMLLLLIENGRPLDVAFEAVSAFSTAGLSRGITPSLSAGGQALVIVLMLAGRIGVITLGLCLATRSCVRVVYPSAQISVG